MLCHFFTPFWGTVTHVRTFSRFLRVLLDFCMFCFVCFVFFLLKLRFVVGRLPIFAPLDVAIRPLDPPLPFGANCDL